MPEKETLRRAREDQKQGKSVSTQAGKFVREEIEHIREGEHGARSAKQAIAIGLSQARRAGIDVRPKSSSRPPELQRKANQEIARAGTKPSAKRSRATEQALKRETRSSVSKKALSEQAKAAAKHRGKEARKRAAIKAAKTRRMNLRHGDS